MVLAIILLVWANVAVRTSGGNTAISVESIQTQPVGIILGAKAYKDGALSAMLADRVNEGIALYRAKKIQKLLLTGDHGTVGYDEVNAMKAYVMAAGVPERDIFTDHAGFSTYESLYRARDVFKIKRAVIVSQKFHLSRALYIARSLGLQTKGLAADLRDYGVYNKQSTFREYFANLKAFWQVKTGAKPTFLGPAIPITGDGRQSRG